MSPKATTVICKQPGRYIGWPTIAKTAGGELLVVFSGDRDEHVCPYGKTQLVRSRDGGHTWSAPVTITDSPIDDRDAGILVLKSGAILVNWFTSLAFEHESQVSWISQKTRDAWKPYIARLTREDRDKYLGYWARCSADDGKSWGEWIRTPVMSPHGPIQLRNRRLLFLGRGSAGGRVFIGAAESRDDGRSWRLIWSKDLKTKEQQENFEEPHVAELPDGRLIGMFRFESSGQELWQPEIAPGGSQWTAGYLWQTESADGGLHWSTPHPTPIWGYPPHLLALRDGRLLCSYGHRRKPYGERACFSYDGGRTWDIDHEVVLRDDAPSDDLGYPASVELDDGSVLTVYYQQDAPDEKTCLMATRWQPAHERQTTAKPRVAIELGEPVTVAMADPEVGRRWGPYQFPGLSRLPEGRIQISFHIEADSAKAYGLPPARAVSADEGKTWTLLPREEVTTGTVASWGSQPLRLSNGDLLSVKQLRPKKASELTLPEQPFARLMNNSNVCPYYRLEDLPAECAAGWMLYRLPAGQAQPKEEKAIVRMPGEVRAVAEGVMPFPGFGMMFLAPDGTLWAWNHNRRVVDGQIQKKTVVIILRSPDQGRTWDIWSEIPYAGDPVADPAAEKREGFTEPIFNFMPDGSVLCLLRTTDATLGPLYWSRSTDNGKTWTPPAIFDNYGVWPQMLTLKNGVTLAVYGRPGLYVRATSDPAGMCWEPKMAVVEPGQPYADTCSYAALLALSDDTALVAYSDFRVRDSEWVQHKTIRVRTIRATRNENK